MTRVNIIPVTELMDQHLMAEYREIRHVPKSLQRTLRSKNGLQRNRISKKYTLNTNHIYFFYNKGSYLQNRFEQIVEELKFRGFNINPDARFPIEDFPEELRNDWVPTIQEQEILRERIAHRISLKPNWYRKTVHKK